MASSGSTASATENGRAETTEQAPEAVLPGCGAWQKTPLLIAARHGQWDAVERVLETSIKQPQLDVVDEKGNTALIVAAIEGHEKVVSMLIDAGADLAIENLEG